MTQIDGMKFLVMIVLTLSGVILWYYIKSILRENEIKTSDHDPRSHLMDIPNMISLVLTTEDKVLKRKYKTLVTALILTIGLFIITAFTIFDCREDIFCRRYNEYLQHEVNGSLKEKFIDKPNHAVETLIIVQNGTEIKENEITIFINGLYDTLAMGDKVIKEKGSSVTTIKRGDIELVFSVDRKDYCQE